jgi:hypothetical protein
MSAFDSMTLGEIKQLLAMFGGAQASPSTPHPMVGKHVILRCAQAGVHAGVLVSQAGDQAVLKDARRLWKWKAKDGIALSGVATHGIVASESKLDTQVSEIALTGVIETIPTTAAARSSIHGS